MVRKVLLTGLLTTSLAVAGDVHFITTVLTKHYNVSNRELYEKNTAGLFIEKDFEHVSIAGGVYKNSFKRTSFAIGITGWFQVDEFRSGLFFGLATGYKDKTITKQYYTKYMLWDGHYIKIWHDKKYTLDHKAKIGNNIGILAGLRFEYKTVGILVTPYTTTLYFRF